MSTNNAFVVKNGLTVGTTNVVDSTGLIDFTRLKNKPTTMAGYGITDGSGFNGTLAGNLTFTGSGRRIIGDLTDTTSMANRLLFQTSVANGNTALGVITNGTGTDSRLVFFGGSDPNNASSLAIGANNTGTFISAEKTGTGTLQPLTIWTGASPKFTFETDGTFKATTNEVQGATRTGGGQFRAIAGTSPAMIIRNDGLNTYFMATNSNDAQGTWNSLRPLSFSMTTGRLTISHGISMSGSIQINNGFGVSTFESIGDIGGAFVDWSNTRWPALQVTANNPASAYMIWRATKWDSRHLCGMDAYQGGSTSTAPICTMHVGSTTNAFTFAEGGNFTAVGNVAAFSDERLKTNWRDVELGLVDKLANVKSGIYDRVDTGETQVGVSAQAMQEILPNAVTEDPMSKHLTLAYGNAAMVAVVEMAKEMRAMKAEIAELKAALADRS